MSPHLTLLALYHSENVFSAWLRCGYKLIVWLLLAENKLHVLWKFIFWRIGQMAEFETPLNGKLLNKTDAFNKCKMEFSKLNAKICGPWPHY